MLCRAGCRLYTGSPPTITNKETQDMYPDLLIHISEKNLRVTQQTARGVFIKQFPPAWEGIAALLKWSCDMVHNGSRIQILVDHAKQLPEARHLAARLQGLECRTGDRRNFNIICRESLQ